MPNTNKKKPAAAPKPREGQHQTDLAEGELETVEESIRAHEQKGDLKPPSSKTPKH